MMISEHLPASNPAWFPGLVSHWQLYYVRRLMAERAVRRFADFMQSMLSWNATVLQQHSSVYLLITDAHLRGCIKIPTELVIA